MLTILGRPLSLAGAPASHRAKPRSLASGLAYLVRLGSVRFVKILAGFHKARASAQFAALITTPPPIAKSLISCNLSGTFSRKLYTKWRSASSTQSEMAAQGAGTVQNLGTLPGPTWVLYHYPCPDGVFAALAAFLYHRAVNKEVRFLPNTVYSPRRVDDLSCTSQDAVYLLDFAGPQGYAEQLAGKAGRVTVLDHHKTALEMLPRPGSGPPNLDTLLDMNRSGATVAWDFFSEKHRQESKPIEKRLASQVRETDGDSGQTLQSAEKPGASGRSDEHLDGREGDRGNAEVTHSFESTAEATGSLPEERRGAFGLSEREALALRWLFDYVEDADLWKWALPESRAFSSGLKDLDVEYDAGKNPGVFEQLLDLKLDDVIRRGRASLAEKDAIIAAALEKSFVVELGNGQYGTCLAVYVDGDVARLRSELGNQLAAKSEAVGHR